MQSTNLWASFESFTYVTSKQDPNTTCMYVAIATHAMTKILNTQYAPVLCAFIPVLKEARTATFSSGSCRLANHMITGISSR